MSDWLVDTSVVVKWVLPEPDSAQAIKVVTDTTSAGGRLYVLDMAIIEAANVIWTRFHRKLLTLAEAKLALGLTQTGPAQVEHGLSRVTPAFDIAVRFGIAVYDALFVATVHELAVGGVTADEPLVRAVGAAYPQIKLLRTW